MLHWISLRCVKAHLSPTRAPRFCLLKSSSKSNTRCRAQPQVPVHLGRLSYSIKTIIKAHQHRNIEVLEISVSNTHDVNDDRDRVTHNIVGNDSEPVKEWDTVCVAGESRTNNITNQIQVLPKKAISLLLPAQYPHSVAEGYLDFVSFCFVASIAGSAAMVLSTQTLLLAVGIVGQSNGGSSVMAGALNWVMKDFMGQLGGIIFASQIGKTKAFDNDPKRWRMVAALALDGATMVEILSPLCHQNLVLPVASIANVGKNIGFLTASAGRAALHQSLAISNNLGDVTVKAGSQSMMASLVGTSLGIGLSKLLDHDTFNFGICFLCLSVIHQGCTYKSLQNVPLAYFNRQRLHLAIEYHLENQMIPAPVDIAKQERFFSFLSRDSSLQWLHIGRSLREVCRTAIELEKYLASAPGEAYLIRLNHETQEIDIIFFVDAIEQDIYRGIYHACLLRNEVIQIDAGSASVREVGLEGKRDQESHSCDTSSESLNRKIHSQVQQNFQHFLDELHAQGWDTSSGVVDAEDKRSHRIQINFKN